MSDEIDTINAESLAKRNRDLCALIVKEHDAFRKQIEWQNNRYAEMSAEADRLSKMVAAFREQDDAIRAEFGGKRDGRPTIECLRDAFAAKWSEEDTLFKGTLDMKTAELRAEVERLRAGGCARDQTTTQYCAEAARLAADNERLRAGLREAFEVYANSEGFIHETAAEGYQQQIIKQMVDCINAALQDKSDESPEGKAVIEGEHEASKP